MTDAIRIKYSAFEITQSISSPKEIFKAKPRPKPQQVTTLTQRLRGILASPFKAICSSMAFYFGVGSASDRRTICKGDRDRLKELGGEEFSFKTEDDVTLEGMHIRNPRAISGAKTILICSGSGQSYENYTVSMADAYLKMGHNVVLFNYRGFGKSEGSPSEEGFYKDTEAAYQFMRDVLGLSDDQMVVHGYSMGSAPATDLACHHNIDLVLDRYFSSMKDVAADQFSNKKLGAIAKRVFDLGGASFDVQGRINSARGRIFLAHETDENGIADHHQEHVRNALANRQGAIFFRVDAVHDNMNHNERLWFHPDDPKTVVPRRALQQFVYPV